MNAKIILISLLTILSINLFAQKTVPAAEFYILIQQNENAIILDANPLKKYKKERIKDAKSIATSKMLEIILNKKDKEIPILVYCEYGDRSKTAVKKIKKLKFINIYQLKDGLIEWKKANYPTDKTSTKK